MLGTVAADVELLELDEVQLAVVAIIPGVPELGICAISVLSELE